MALGVLGIIFYTIIALVIIGSIGLIVLKNGIAEKALIGFMVIFSILIGILTFVSAPSNYIVTKIIAIVISLIPVGGVALAYYKKINKLVLKILIILGNVLGSLYLLI